MSIDISKVAAIDPNGCICEKCLKGEQIPYDSPSIKEVLEATLNGEIAPLNNINRDRLTNGTIIIYRGSNGKLFVAHDFTMVNRSDIVVVRPNFISPLTNRDVRDARNDDDEFKQESLILDIVNGATTANTTNSTFITYVSPNGEAGIIELPATSPDGAVVILPYGR